MSARTTAIILGVVLVVYLVISIGYGYAFISTGSPLAIGIGIGMLILPLLGFWIVWREFRFGTNVEAMAKELEQAGELPLDNLPRTQGGRVDREAADAEFERMRGVVESDPNNWKPWFNLATAYDAAGDRKRARESMRHAWALYERS